MRRELVPTNVCWMERSRTKGRFHAIRRMGATHIGAPKTQQLLKGFCFSWTNPGAYFISFVITHFQASTTIGWRDSGFSCIPPL